MRKAFIVLLAAMALTLGFAGSSIASPGKGENTKPLNPPCDADHGHPAANSPRCQTPPPPPPPPAGCPATALPGNLDIAVPQLANVCVTLFILEGSGDPVCPDGQIEIPVTTIPGVVAACATLFPAAAA